MFFKSSYKGVGMFKYGLFSWILKLCVWVIWVIFALIPYGERFINLLNESANSGVWDIKSLLTPLFYIFLWGFILAVIEAIIGFGIFFIAKDELNKR